METMTRRHDGESQELERRGREEVAATVRIHEAAVSESCAAVIFILVTVTKEVIEPQPFSQQIRLLS